MLTQTMQVTDGTDTDALDQEYRDGYEDRCSQIRADLAREDIQAGTYDDPEIIDEVIGRLSRQITPGHHQSPACSHDH